MKMVLGLLALFGAAASTPTLADVITPPSHVAMKAISVGKLENGIASVTDGVKSVRVKIEGCNINWTTGEQFYALATQSVQPIIVKKSDFDYVWTKSDNNWSLTLTTLVKANVVCTVATP